MVKLIRIVIIALLNGIVGFLVWNAIYYKKEHCFIKPSAGWLPVSDLIRTLLATGIIIGVISVL